MIQNSNRGMRGKSAVSLSKNFGRAQDSSGNRKASLELKIPPDDVGNKLDSDSLAFLTHDGLGNSLLEEPSHLKSGILSDIADRRNGPNKTLRQNYKPVAQFQRQTKFSKSFEQGEDYKAVLIKEFLKLLSEKSGLPFSFSMKKISDKTFDEEAEAANLASLKLVIEDLLLASQTEASVALSEYGTLHHRFAVFLINPIERDPTRNKELISALRQVIELHLLGLPEKHINILLILANAEHIVESHLLKIGAEKLCP